MRQAAEQGHWRYVEEYLSLLCLWRRGALPFAQEALPSLLLKRRRMEKAFFGFENQEDLTTLCFGAAPTHLCHAVLTGLARFPYREEHLYNRAFLPLAERLRDFLITRFHLKPNGRRQVLEGDVVVHLPSVLAYDLHDGENCCKHNFPAPEGCEVVSGQVLAFWSQRVLENWSLFKREREKGPRPGKSPCPAEGSGGRVHPRAAGGRGPPGGPAL